MRSVLELCASCPPLNDLAFENASASTDLHAGYGSPPTALAELGPEIGARTTLKGKRTRTRGCQEPPRAIENPPSRPSFGLDESSQVRTPTITLTGGPSGGNKWDAKLGLSEPRAHSLSGEAWIIRAHLLTKDQGSGLTTQGGTSSFDVLVRLGCTKQVARRTRDLFSLRHALLEHPDQNHSGSPGHETQLSLSVTWIQSTGKRRPSALRVQWLLKSIWFTLCLGMDATSAVSSILVKAHTFTSVQKHARARILYMIGAIVKRRLSADLIVCRPERPL